MISTFFLSFLSVLPAIAGQVSPERIAPPALEKGDTVGLTAPASPLPESQIRRAVANIEKRGFKVKVAATAGSRRGYLAADDATRAAQFNQMLRDPGVKAVFCLRGGYGSPRILDRIDYEALRLQPKIVMGYSDITALLNAIQKKTGVVCFHGPMGKEWGLGRGPTPFSEKYIWGCLMPHPDLWKDWGGARFRGMKPPVTITGGVAEGTLVGGNLSLICSVMGTPYEVDTRGAILFLEDVAEKPFRIDRMLNQLRLAEKLRQAKGVILGGFPGCDARNTVDDLPLDEVFHDYLVPLGVPVLSNYPAGHVPDNVTLPIGVRVRLDATAKTLTILDAPVQAPSDAAAPEDPR